MQTACVFTTFVTYCTYADAHGVTRAKTNISEQQAAPGGRAAAKSHLCKKRWFSVGGV